MAGRDTVKNFYINGFALERDSWTTQAFLDDMKVHHQTETPGKFAASIIGEYYELKAKLDKYGIVFVGNAPVATVATSSNGNGHDKNNGNSRRSRPAPEPEPEDQGDDDGGLGDVADYWGKL